MNNKLFIFQYADANHFQGTKTITVVFSNQEILDNQEYIADEIKIFFEQNTASDYVVVLLPYYLSAENRSWFIEDKVTTFKRLPGRSKEYFENHYFVYTYEKDGSAKAFPKRLVKEHESFLKNIYRHGNTEIFKKNGGLVESSIDHHFVFPSKKHCSKFIRTGNVLVHSSELFFIALQLLPFFKEQKTIYCDTSSINVLPFALFELKRRFGDKYSFPAIESFKSYEVFESRKIPFGSDDFILISSSTSGNIIDRLFTDRLATKNQILLIYYLGPEKRFRDNESNILCNLTKSESFSSGVEQFETYPNELACQLCKNHSYPIQIKGDVFLTVKPKISKVLLSSTSKHVPNFLNEFVNDYRINKSTSPNEAIIRAFYKETKGDSEVNYETYIDTSRIYGTDVFKGKLEQLINKFIPANTKYIIYLPDESSKKLANIVVSKIQWKVEPSLLKLDDYLSGKLTNIDGSAVIIASCIVTGKNLLQLSKLMRPFNKLSLIYFIGVLGTSNEGYQNDLKNNLIKGKVKSDERPFVAVETIFCSLDKYNTTWQREKQFLETYIIPEVDEENPLYGYIKERLVILRNNKQTIGLTDDVFLTSHKGDRLYLRKNFAFWKFDYEEEDIFQSEVYFSINSIINFLENKEITDEGSLRQSTYVRNLLSADNFQRFNDGIIQACLLRAAKPEYFAYDLDVDSSTQIKTLIESMLDKHNTEHGEALMEFLLALGMKILRLRKMDTVLILEKAIECDNAIIAEFSKLINAILIKEQVI